MEQNVRYAMCDAISVVVVRLVADTGSTVAKDVIRAVRQPAL